MEIKRIYTKRETEKSNWSGRVGHVELVVPEKGWTLDGATLGKASVEYLANFALQSLQDAYAGADTLDAAIAAWDKKRHAIIDGTIGIRGVGNGEEAHMPYVRGIVRKALGETNKALYDDIPSDDQKARAEFLTGLFDGLDEAKQKAVTNAAKAQLEIAREQVKVAKEAAADIGL